MATDDAMLYEKCPRCNGTTWITGRPLPDGRRLQWACDDTNCVRGFIPVGFTVAQVKAESDRAADFEIMLRRLVCWGATPERVALAKDLLKRLGTAKAVRTLEVKDGEQG